MRTFLKKEVIVSVLILVLIGWSLKPFAMPMSAMAETAVGATLVLLFALLTGLLLREQAQDEREELHRAMADRIGFLAGAGVLTVITAVQSFQHHVDPWVVGALGVMILAKMVGLIYSQLKK